MFPLPAEALDGQRVLLIGLVRTDARNAYFVSGVASWSDQRLSVAYDPMVPSLKPLGTPLAWRGFDPCVLPDILLPKAWRRVEPLASGVAACVVSWLPDSVPSALVIGNAFFGVATNGATGEIFLMQGDPSSISMFSANPDLDPAT